MTILGIFYDVFTIMLIFERKSYNNFTNSVNIVLVTKYIIVNIKTTFIYVIREIVTSR